MILVTGGLGYLGGRMVDALVGAGLKVRVATSRKISLLPEVDKLPYEVVEIELMSIESLNLACNGVSHIIHLAALNAIESNSDQKRALMINGVGVLNLLKAAESNSVSNFIYFSTIHVYGNSLKGHIDEYTLPVPINSYAITHRLAEDYVLEAHARGVISSVIFRLSNVVGPPMVKDVNCWGLVTNNLCRQAVAQGTLNLKTSRNSERDFISISVISDLVLHAINQNLFKGEIFNVSSNNTSTLESLVNLIATRCNKILKTQPLISFSDDSSSSVLKNKPIFQISNKKIIDTGFLIKLDIQHDIDNLLKSCKKWFG